MNATLFDKAARKPAKAKKSRRPKGWKVADSVTVLPAGSNVRTATVVAGDEVTIIGFRGRSKFIEYVESPKGNWVTVIHQGKFRSIEADYIYTVHKMTAAQAEARKLAARSKAKAAAREARRAEAQAARDAEAAARRSEARRAEYAAAGQVSMFA